MIRGRKSLSVCLILISLTFLLDIPRATSTFDNVDSGTAAQIRSIAWRPDGRFALLVGTLGSLIKTNGTFYTEVPSNTTRNLYGVAWKPDGSFALVVGEFGTVLAFRDPLVVPVESTFTQLFYTVAWKPDGSFALIGGADGTLLRFDGSTFSDLSPKVLALNSPNARIGDLRKIAWKPDGSLAVVVGSRGTVLSTDGQSVRLLSAGPSSINTIPLVMNQPGVNMQLNDVAWKPDGSFAIIIGLGRTILRTDGTSAPAQIPGVPVQFYSPLTDSLVSISWKPDGSYAIMVSKERGNIYKFDGTTIATIRPNFDIPQSSWAAVAWNPSGLYALILSPTGKGLTYSEEPPNLSVQVSPASQVINPGQSATYFVLVSSVNGFRGDVSFFVFGQPTIGARSLFNPVTAILTPNGQVRSAVTIQTNPCSITCATGFFFLRMGAAGRGVTQNQTATLAITTGGEATTFAIQATPDNETIRVGGIATYTIDVFPFGGFNQPITFQSQGLPTGVQDVYSARTITTLPNRVTVTLSTVEGTTPTGRFPVTFLASGGATSQQVIVFLSVIAENTLILDVKTDNQLYYPSSVVTVWFNVKLGGQLLATSRVSGAPISVTLNDPTGTQFATFSPVSDRLGNASISFTLPLAANIITGAWTVITTATATPSQIGGFTTLQISKLINFQVTTTPILRGTVSVQVIDVAQNPRSSFTKADTVVIRFTVTNTGSLDLTSAFAVVTVTAPNKAGIALIPVRITVPQGQSVTSIVTFTPNVYLSTGQYGIEVDVLTALISQGGLIVEGASGTAGFQLTS